MEPTVGVIDIIDPWWGYVGSAIVPANQIIGSVSDNAWGLNGGGGVTYGLGQSGAEVFAEVRYHYYAHTTPTITSIYAGGLRCAVQQTAAITVEGPTLAAAAIECAHRRRGLAPSAADHRRSTIRSTIPG